MQAQWCIYMPRKRKSIHQNLGQGSQHFRPKAFQLTRSANYCPPSSYMVVEYRVCRELPRCPTQHLVHMIPDVRSSSPSPSRSTGSPLPRSRLISWQLTTGQRREMVPENSPCIVQCRFKTPTLKQAHTRTRDTGGSPQQLSRSHRP